MKVLFLSVQETQATSAYALRLNYLRAALEARGIETGFMSLRAQRFPRPLLLHPLNVPMIRREAARYDFIHAGGDAAYTAAFLKPFIPGKIVYDVHDDTWYGTHMKWLTHPGPHMGYLLAQSWVMNAVSYPAGDYFLVVSKPLGRRLVEDKHVSPDRIALIRNGVDLEKFKPVDDYPETFTVGYAGSYKAWQAIDTLTGAVESLPADLPVRLKMIGFKKADGELKARLKQQLGSRVELVDRVPHAELAAHLASVSVLVSPRRAHRGTQFMFPSKFAEYAALGKPLIVFDLDEGGDLVSEYDCGYVCQPTAESLAAAIRQAAAAPPAEIERMGRNARRLAEAEFSWADIGEKYARFLLAWGAGSAVPDAALQPGEVT